MIACIGFADKGIDQCPHWSMNSPPGCSILIRSSLVHQKRAAPKRVLLFLVDLKGIEPSNLTDANRALSQLSYKPLYAFSNSFLFERFVIITRNLDL